MPAGYSGTPLARKLGIAPGARRLGGPVEQRAGLAEFGGSERLEGTDRAALRERIAVEAGVRTHVEAIAFEIATPVERDAMVDGFVPRHDHVRQVQRLDQIAQFLPGGDVRQA